jgi:nucleoside-diphosphate-sugar epimerase
MILANYMKNCLTPKTNRILLTGCSGYIGRTLAPYLKQQGYYVFGFDRKPCTAINLDGFIQGNLLDNVLLRYSLDGIDTVVHLAAAKDDWGLSDEEYFRDNVIATQEVLRVAGGKGIRNWIFFSSVAVMGTSNSPLDESAPIAPLDAYGMSKAHAETLFHRFAKEEPSARILIIRPSVVFGPDNPLNTNIYRLIDAIYNNQFVMIGKGNVIKTTSYIENLVAATLFLMNKIQRGVRTFIYVDEPKLSTAELVRWIYRLLQKSPPKWNIPLSVAMPFAYLADIAAVVTRKDLPITAARIKKFCRPTNFDAYPIRELGFKQPVPLDEGFHRTVEWYRSVRGSRGGVKEIQRGLH